MLNSDIAEMITGKGYAKERIIADSAEPKSNDDLKRLGLTRVTPSAKGADSIRAGIAEIQEYSIIVHPYCKNTVSELSSYCWERDRFNNGLNRPIDRDNHLMDALRYAFQDVKAFHPRDPWQKTKRSDAEKYYGGEIVLANDFFGGWS